MNPLKQKVLLAYHQDGILDLMAGAVVISFALDMLTNNIAFLMAGWLSIPLYFVLKQRVTIPRFGYVRFESQDRSKSKLLLLLGFGMLVLALFVAGIFLLDRQPDSASVQQLLQRYHMVPLSALLFALPALLAAIFLGLKRYYLYAFLAVALPFLAALIGIETYLPIFATGLTLLGYGLVLLIGFLKKYPNKQEVNDDVNG